MSVHEEDHGIHGLDAIHGKNRQSISRDVERDGKVATLPVPVPGILVADIEATLFKGHGRAVDPHVDLFFASHLDQVEDQSDLIEQPVGPSLLHVITYGRPDLQTLDINDEEESRTEPPPPAGRTCTPWG